MKFTTTRTLAAIVIAITGATATTAALCGPKAERWNGPGFTEERLERMTQHLDLTTDQQTQIRAILEEQSAAREAQRIETRQRIDAVLTEEQRAERDQTMNARMDRRMERMTDRLDLTADQSDAIRAIMLEGRNNPQLTRAQIREQIAGVLTEEQLEQFQSRGKKGCGPSNRGGFGGHGPRF